MHDQTEELVEMECIYYQNCSVTCMCPPDTEYPICEECQIMHDQQAQERKEHAEAKEALYFLARSFGIANRDPWDIVNAVIAKKENLNV